MDSAKKIQTEVTIEVVLLNIILAAAGFFIIKEPLPFLRGLFFGTIIALLNFRLLHIALQKAVHMPPHKAQAYAASRYFVRMFIIGITVYVSLKADNINALGTIIGLITLKPVLLRRSMLNKDSMQFFKNIFKRKEVK